MTPDASAGELDLTEDRLLGGRLRLLQPRQGHRFGTDAVLLAAVAACTDFSRAVELGAGVGAAGLALAAAKAVGEIVLVEIVPELAALAARNAAANGLGARVDVEAADAASAGRAGVPASIAAGSADLVLMNPPFHADSAIRASADPLRVRAHAAPAGLLADWTAAAARLLRPRGRLVLLHRADAIGAALSTLQPRFGSFSVLPVHPTARATAIRIVIEGVLGGRAPLQLRPGLVLHAGDGRFTPIAEALHTGDFSAVANAMGRPEAPQKQSSERTRIRDG